MQYRFPAADETAGLQNLVCKIIPHLYRTIFQFTLKWRTIKIWANEQKWIIAYSLNSSKDEWGTEKRGKIVPPMTHFIKTQPQYKLQHDQRVEPGLFSNYHFPNFNVSPTYSDYTFDKENILSSLGFRVTTPESMDLSSRGIGQGSGGRVRYLQPYYAGTYPFS